MSHISLLTIPTYIKSNIRIILLNMFAVAFIYFVPAFSHMLSYPLYLIEPMRIMVILAMIHTNRNNALILAATLPLVSYFFSAHPVFLKSILISAELIINVFVFYALYKRINVIIAIFSSIWISKIIYYAIKYLSILWMFPEDKLISTPLHIQLITSLVLSVYVFFVLFMKRKNT